MEISKPCAFRGGAYIATSVVLAGIAMADPDHIVIWAWAAALVFVAPSTFPLARGCTSSVRWRQGMSRT